MTCRAMVIPLASAYAIREHVARLPLTLSHAELPGGREIRPAELQQAMAWLGGLGSSPQGGQRGARPVFTVR